MPARLHVEQMVELGTRRAGDRDGRARGCERQDDGGRADDGSRRKGGGRWRNDEALDQIDA